MSAKFSTSAMFGMIPKTSALEEKENKLFQDFNNFNEYKESEELAHFKELDAFVASPEFEKIKKEINAKKFPGSEPYEKEKKHKALKKSKEIKTFYQVKDSQELKNYESFSNSDKLANYEELNQFFNSSEFEEFKKSLIQQKTEKLQAIKDKKAKFKELKKGYKASVKANETEKIEAFKELENEITSSEYKKHIEEVKSIKFKNTEEFKKLQEYKALKKSSEIKQYFKFKNSQKLAIYNKLNNSQDIADFEELESYINSEEFKKEKEYLLTKDKFKISEEYKQEQEYKKLKDSEKIKWFFKTEKKNDFDKLAEWELTFEDNFEGNKLDTEKWMSGYFWGKNLLNDDYVQANERHFFKEDNLEINNSNLTIVTKQEKAEGKVWDPALGFYNKNFNYTSGLINTGQSFRQKYGLFKAKIKLNHSYPVHHAFWLLGEKITPEIDIFKYGLKSGSKLQIANYPENINTKGFKKTLGGTNFSKDYFIYSLEWTKDKLVWKINDLVLFEQTENIPQEPMYIILSSGISNDGNINSSNMLVDWVRAYKRN